MANAESPSSVLQRLPAKTAARFRSGVTDGSESLRTTSKIYVSFINNPPVSRQRHRTGHEYQFYCINLLEETEEPDSSTKKSLLVPVIPSPGEHTGRDSNWCVLGSKIYSVGGFVYKKKNNYGGSPIPCRNLSVFNLSTDEESWSVRTSMTKRRKSYQVTGFNGKIYVVDDSKDKHTAEELTSDPYLSGEVYDPDKDQWEPLGHDFSPEIMPKGSLILDNILYVASPCLYCCDLGQEPRKYIPVTGLAKDLLFPERHRFTPNNFGVDKIRYLFHLGNEKFCMVWSEEYIEDYCFLDPSLHKRAYRFDPDLPSHIYNYIGTSINSHVNSLNIIYCLKFYITQKGDKRTASFDRCDHFYVCGARISSCFSADEVGDPAARPKPIALKEVQTKKKKGKKDKRKLHNRDEAPSSATGHESIAVMEDQSKKKTRKKRNLHISDEVSNSAAGTEPIALEKDQRKMKKDEGKLHNSDEVGNLATGPEPIALKEDQTKKQKRQKRRGNCITSIACDTM